MKRYEWSPAWRRDPAGGADGLVQFNVRQQSHWMRSMLMAKRSHHTASLLRLNKACGSERHTVITADAEGEATLLKKPLRLAK